MELMLEALSTEVAGQEDNEVDMWSDPLRWALPAQQLRTHTPPRLPAIVTHSLRQAAARLFTVPARPCTSPRTRCAKPETKVLMCSLVPEHTSTSAL